MVPPLFHNLVELGSSRLVAEKGTRVDADESLNVPLFKNNFPEPRVIFDCTSKI